MKQLELTQGSPEWHAARLQHRAASEAPIMMGASTKGLRNELLRLKKTGESKVVSDWVQKNLYDKGHELEAQARALLEEDISQELYPVVATDDDGWLLASVDGMTIDDQVLFEHKGWNEQLAAMVRAEELTPEYYWQLEQQLLVTGADMVIFVVSDGTREKREQMDYYPVKGRAEQLVAGWKQFDIDLAEYTPPVVVEKVQAESIDNLPALVVKLSGQVSASNLDEYKTKALGFIEAINTDLQTDQDFANAEATVKFCERSEAELKNIKERALEDTRSIKDLFDTVDQLSEAMRQKRLTLSKLVTARKDELKAAIRVTAEQSFAAHITAINAEIGPRVAMPAITCDVATAMKGKRSLASLQDAADTTLAQAKIEANAIAEKIRANLKVLRELDKKYVPLFSDAQLIVQKDAEDFANVVKLRVAEADETERKRLLAEAAERERIREEEAEKLRLKHEREQEEAKKAQDEAEAAEAAKKAAASEPETPKDEPQQEALFSEPAVAETVAEAPKADEPVAKRQPDPEPVRLAQSPAGRYVYDLIDIKQVAAAVAAGDAPIGILLLNHDAMDDLMKIHQGNFAVSGVNIKAAG
ncbi:YqaJ viral recombinase family protein [Agrobacterium tumefaciens]|uniref:YqaJ viral recombinase family protein n=1 Tax=Agrobacterium tumefaciens TaxID=358 RepID=UPI001573312F|nr:Heme peroxidase [Agrobacterium tumefaciens]